MSEKKSYDLFGTFRHASYNVQRHEPSASPTDDDTTSNPSAPLMGGPSKHDKNNLSSYPVTPEKTAKGKSRGSYSLIKMDKDSDIRENDKRKNLLRTLFFIILATILLFLIFFGVWAFVLRTDSSCQGAECNTTVVNNNMTQVLLSGMMITYNETTSEKSEYLDLEQSFADSGETESIKEENDSSILINCLSQYTDQIKEHFLKFIETEGKVFESDEEKCEAINQFNKSQDSINALNNKYKNLTAFGLTIFSDWNDQRRSETGVDSTTSVSFKTRQVSVPNIKENSEINFMDYSYSIVFNDDCSMKWNIKMALKTIHENIKTKNTSKKPSSQSSAKCDDNDTGLYEIEYTRSDRDFKTKWLLSNGPFVTNLLVCNTFFDYKNGTFIEEMCASEATTFAYVLVIGNGKSLHPVTSKVMNFWHIMPIGSVWKKWGNGGYMRITMDACIAPENNDKLIAYFY